jgi:hypothetical protein
MRILGEIPLRKVGGNGEVIRDPEGNPDTSFWARIPADTPITFQMLDREGRVLTMAQTWHQVRPGEVRVDCGGCHSHSQTPLGFERTAAALQPPVDLTTTTVRDVEFIRDIRPLLQRSCVNCHSGDPASAPGSLSLDDTSMIAGVLPDTPVPSTPTDYARLARDRTARFGIKPPTGAHQNWVGANASRYVRIFQSRRSLLAWKLGGARTDGWDNSRWESTAPFTSDLARLLWDLDFNPGTVDHSTMLSNAEKRTVYAWIDLAAPVDLGGGYWRDENRPTLTVKVTNGVALVGAADAYSGLNESTVSLTVNGLFVALTKQSQGIWSAAVPAGSATLVATAMDNAGNITQQTLRIGPPPQGIMPRAPTGLHVQ